MHVFSKASFPKMFYNSFYRLLSVGMTIFKCCKNRYSFIVIIFFLFSTHVETNLEHLSMMVQSLYQNLAKKMEIFISQILII